MKCHIRVDSGSGLVHTITATAANAHDITEAHKLLREDDHVAYGDSGYIGIEKRDEIKNNEHFRKIDFRISRRPKSLPQVSDHAIENRKSAVRCKVEHAFKIIKDTFGFRKVRYRGLAKNFNKLNVLFACANLLMVKRGQIKSQKALIRGSVYPFADNRLQMKLEKLKNSSILVKILLF